MIERHRAEAKRHFGHLLTEQIGPAITGNRRTEVRRLHLRGLLHDDYVTQRRQVGRKFGEC